MTSAKVSKGHRIDPLDLEGLHEALRLSIVIRIAAAAHRADQPVRDQGVTIELGGVLGAAVGMIRTGYMLSG